MAYEGPGSDPYSGGAGTYADDPYGGPPPAPTLQAGEYDGGYGGYGAYESPTAAPSAPAGQYEMGAYQSGAAADPYAGGSTDYARPVYGESDLSYEQKYGAVQPPGDPHAGPMEKVHARTPPPAPPGVGSMGQFAPPPPEEEFHREEGLFARVGSAMPHFHAHPGKGAPQQEDVEGGEMQPTVHKPYFIYFVTILQVVMFGATVLVNGGFESSDVNPMFGPSVKVLIEYGANDGARIRDDGQWWRFLTPILLHAGVLHLISNLAFQLTGGVSLERAVGWKVVGITYIVAGIGGNVASAVFLPQFAGVGASSALYGLIGSMLADLLINWSVVASPIRGLVQYIISIGIGLGMGLLPFVDNFAHLGGMVCGFFMGMIVNPKAKFGLCQCGAIFVAVPALVIYFLVGLVMFYSEVNAHGWCTNCQYLSCVDYQGWCDAAPTDPQ